MDNAPTPPPTSNPSIPQPPRPVSIPGAGSPATKPTFKAPGSSPTTPRATNLPTPPTIARPQSPPALGAVPSSGAPIEKNFDEEDSKEKLPLVLLDILSLAASLTFAALLTLELLALNG